MSLRQIPRDVYVRVVDDIRADIEWWRTPGRTPRQGCDRIKSRIKCDIPVSTIIDAARVCGVTISRRKRDSSVVVELRTLIERTSAEIATIRAQLRHLASRLGEVLPGDPTPSRQVSIVTSNGAKR